MYWKHWKPGPDILQNTLHKITNTHHQHNAEVPIHIHLHKWKFILIRCCQFTTNIPTIKCTFVYTQVYIELCTGWVHRYDVGLYLVFSCKNSRVWRRFFNTFLKYSVYKSSGCHSIFSTSFSSFSLSLDIHNPFLVAFCHLSCLQCRRYFASRQYL